VVLRDQVSDPAMIDAPTDELGIGREERGSVIVYTLDP
jgi:hypothetical protein